MNLDTSRMTAYGDGAAERIQSLADGAKSAAADIGSRASDAIGTSADWATAKGAQLNTRSRELVGSLSDSVSARPLMAVGIAVLAGLLISKLFSRN
jgi:ElaB/YqjD/DUF883 family membrane-anchored ribosome-binding protein